MARAPVCKPVILGGISRCCRFLVSQHYPTVKLSHRRCSLGMREEGNVVRLRKKGVN
jgi:hypothetical protein